MRFMKLLLSGCAAGLFVVANSTTTTAAMSVSDADTVKELTTLSDAWDKAIINHDRAGVEGNMAPDFKQIRGSGNMVERDEFIRDILDPQLKIDPYKLEDFSVKVLGDTALLYGRIRMTGTDEGKRFESHFRYIDIYVRRGGKWKVISVQVTPMPAEKK